MDFDTFRGYAPINRNIIYDPIIKDPVLFQMYMYLVIKANHAPNEIIHGGNRIVIERGSTLTSRDLIAEHLHIKSGTVPSRLRKLTKAGYITTKATNRYTMVTIVNYNIVASMPESDEKNNNRKTSKKHPINIINNNNNDDNQKNVKKKN